MFHHSYETAETAVAATRLSAQGPGYAFAIEVYFRTYQERLGVRIVPKGGYLG